MGNILNLLQAHWVSVLELLGGIHVILNVVGKITGSKAIQGLDNTFFSILNALGVKLPVDAAESIAPPKS